MYIVTTQKIKSKFYHQNLCTWVRKNIREHCDIEIIGVHFVELGLFLKMIVWK